MGLDDMARIQWSAARELRDTMLCHIERKKRAATAGRLAAQSELSYQAAAGSLGRGGGNRQQLINSGEPQTFPVPIFKNNGGCYSWGTD